MSRARFRGRPIIDDALPPREARLGAATKGVVSTTWSAVSPIITRWRPAAPKRIRAEIDEYRRTETERLSSGLRNPVVSQEAALRLAKLLLIPNAVVSHDWPPATINWRFGTEEFGKLKMDAMAGVEVPERIIEEAAHGPMDAQHRVGGLIAGIRMVMSVPSLRERVADNSPPRSVELRDAIYAISDGAYGFDWDVGSKTTLYVRNTPAEMHWARRPVQWAPDRIVWHNESGPAVVLHNGAEYYYLSGVEVPVHLVTSPPEDITLEEILGIRNVDVRRAVIDRVGLHRVLNDTNSREIDRATLRIGDIDVRYRLMEVDLRGLVVADTRWPRTNASRYLWMENPSTGDIHMEGVPNTANDVLDAIAWRNNAPRGSLPEWIA